MEGFNFDPAIPKCLFCGSHKLRRIKASAFDVQTPTWVSIVECLNCHFAWQHPLGRTEKQSESFFKAAYLDKGKSTTTYFSEVLKQDIAGLEYGFIASLPVEDHVLMDIGAGAGIFAILAANNGWQVTALDPALDPSWVAHTPNVTAINGSLDDIATERMFDVITLWDVIEHVSDPARLLEDIFRHIKPGGWLVIETGNYKSADRVQKGKSHWMYQLDHRWYFSPDSMELLVKNSGFSEFVYSKRVLRPDWHGSLGYAGPSRGQTLGAILKNPMNLRSCLSRHRELVEAKTWQMSGLGIFAIAARKPSCPN